MRENACPVRVMLSETLDVLDGFKTYLAPRGVQVWRTTSFAGACELAVASVTAIVVIPFFDASPVGQLIAAVARLKHSAAACLRLMLVAGEHRLVLAGGGDARRAHSCQGVDHFARN